MGVAVGSVKIFAPTIAVPSAMLVITPNSVAVAVVGFGLPGLLPRSIIMRACLYALYSSGSEVLNTTMRGSSCVLNSSAVCRKRVLRFWVWRCRALIASLGVSTILV